MMTCKNCNHPVEGNFCPHCGQSTQVGRIDFKYLVNQLPNSMLQVNRGFLFTVKELFLRPGHSIREFIIGKRKDHYKPIAYLIITSTLYVLSAYLMGRNTFLQDIMSGFRDGMVDKNEPADLGFLDWIIQNQTYIIFLFLPLFSLASYLAFLSSKYNFFEHFVLNLYITGQQMVIYLILSFVFFQDNFLLLIPIVLGTLYNIWTFYQFFEDKKGLHKLLLILASYLLFFIILFSILFTIAGIVNYWP